MPLAVICAGDSDCPLTVNSNQCIPVKNTSGRSVVVFCACKIIELFSIMFYMVTAVNKFDFRHATNDTPNKWRPAEISS